MASFSPAAAQFRVLGGVTSARNVFSRKTSLKYSYGGVSFGLLSFQFQPLNTGGFNRRTANGVVPVAGVIFGRSPWSSAKKVETLARILKERAKIFAGTSTQLPDDAADEIARLAMEAAERLFMTSPDKFERISANFSHDDYDTPFLGGFSISIPYESGAEYRRFLNEEARRIAKEVAHMLTGTSTQQLPDDDANELERSVVDAANNTFSAGETKEKRYEDIWAENHSASSDDSWSR